MCKHPIEMLIGTHDGIRCQCGAVFASWAELEEARKNEEPAKPETKSVKRRKKATE
jgi:hypothetical protein